MILPRPEHLQPTAIIDTDHEAVQAFTHQWAGDKSTPIDRAVSLYYAVRDEIRYNPYMFALSEKELKASSALEKMESWCVPKAVLLAACCRILNIPARVGFADVRNHLSTQRLRDTLKTDLFAWHGYTLLYLNDKWIKATPAFNQSLCEKFRLATLEFDGEHDALFQPFDLNGNAHMEYVLDRGGFDDVPLVEMRESIRQIYGQVVFEHEGSTFQRDVEKENS